MKRLVLFAAIFLLITAAISGIEKNGKHITAHGNIHALILFIQFDDDSLTVSEAWPYDTLSLPKWCYQFIDSSNTASEVFNLTQYFSEMSDHKFLLTGDVYPSLIRPKYNQSHYKNIGDVNYEILTELDSVINFAKYDKWTSKNIGQFSDTADGIVDMIYLIYRDFQNKLFYNRGWSGSAELYLTDDIKTNDGVVIKRGQMKSGTQIRGGKHGFQYNKYVAAHEFGHFLFGAGHIEGVTNLALMTGGPVWNASRGMLSWEREKLGWISYTDINASQDSTYTLSDYMTSSEVLRLKLSDNEWYLLENRQKLSANDYAGDKGIYIYYVNDSKHRLPLVEVKCADGFWDFEINKVEQTLTKVKPNTNGKSEMNFTQHVNKIGYSCYEQVYGSNDAWGDETDAFDLNYNNILSPVSNPSSNNRTNIPFTIEIVEQTDSAYTIQFYFENVYAGKPSKPQNFNAKIDSSNRLSLTWSPNKEPDITRYHVYKKASTHNDWELVDIVFHRNDVQHFQWIDKRTILTREDEIYYSITVVDLEINESVKTDECKIEFDEKRNTWTITNFAYN